MILLNEGENEELDPLFNNSFINNSILQVACNATDLFLANFETKIMTT